MSEQEDLIDLNNNELTGQEDFFRQLFNVYDTEQLGYVRTQTFLQISLQNKFDAMLGGEEELDKLIGLLDPHATGKIEYDDFVRSMSHVMADKNDQSFLEGQEFISRSRQSTFVSESTVDVVQMDKSLTEEIFESYETETHLSSNKTSSNEYEFADLDSDLNNESSDYFGIDTDMLNSHRKSLSMSRSFSMNGIVKSSKRLSIQQQLMLESSLNVSPNYEDEADTGASAARYEEIIEGLEAKLKEMSTKNEHLTFENTEYERKVKILSAENTRLFERNREFEDQNLELERKFLQQIDDENSRHQEAINKMDTLYQEEKENLLIKIKSLELKCKEQTNENLINQRKIGDLTKLCEQRDLQVSHEAARLRDLQEEYQYLHTQLANTHSSHEKLKQEHESQLDELKRELSEARESMQLFQHEQLNQRKNTLFEESSYLTQIWELSAENEQFKVECEKMSKNIIELNANLEIYKTNLREDELAMQDIDGITSAGNSLLMQLPHSVTQESFLSEINSTKEDELLEKLIEERQNTSRLRDYIEELTTRILESSCPEILENKPVLPAAKSSSPKKASLYRKFLNKS